MDLMSARSVARKTGGTRVQTGDYYSFDGGLNLVDTPLTIKPGELLASLNYDIGIRGGYRRLMGYERVDGRTKPSDASYWLVPYTGATLGLQPAVGSTVTTASGSGVLLLALTATSGNMVLGRVTGTFSAAQAIQKTGPVTFATASGAAVADNADLDADNVAYSTLASEDQRALISLVPGEGSILGVATMNGTHYAFRNAVGGASAAMFKSSSSGWTAVSLGVKVKFNTGGATAIAAGDTVTGFTSGATGVVRRVVLQSGSWAGSNAVGYLIFASVTGAFTAAEQMRVGGVQRALAVSQANQTLAPNGKYEFRVNNFYGHTTTRRLYGVDGANFGFEYQDGATPFFVQIETGMSNDKPVHLETHTSRLFYGFPGGSLQCSGVNDPAQWTVNTGAAEWATGDDIVGLQSQINKTLFVFSRNRCDYLTGSSSTDWAFLPFTDETGAFEWSIQKLAGGIFLDDRGFSNLSAAQEYGNFNAASFSDKIQPIVTEVKLLTTASVTVKSLNTYRIFFSDGRFLSIAVRGKKIVGFMPGFYDDIVRCAYSGEDSSGTELVLFGSDDGYVYQAESGSNFDGGALTYFLRLPFHHSKSPGRVKRYRRAQFDIRPTGSATINIGVDYSYGRSDVVGDANRVLALAGGGGYWNISQWNTFRWSTGFVADASVKLEGSGENVGFLIAGQSSSEQPHVIEGVILHESMRRVERGSQRSS
jgi:hypothetical protein